MSKLLLGCHVSMCKPDYLLGSLYEAIDYGANTFMFYTGAPQNSIRTELKYLKIDEFKKALKENGFNINELVVHAPYIINIGSSHSNIWHASLKTLQNEINRTNTIGCSLFVLHPGFATKTDKNTAIKNIAKAINLINQKNKDVVICLETMSGKGSEVGSTFEELKQIIELVDKKSLIGVCFDTCHVFDANYTFDQIIKKFDETIGLKYLKVIHVNDSKNKIGSHKDRHENIGYGHIGFDNLCKFIHHEKIKDIPKILETPWFKNKPMYKYEIECLNNKKWKDFR